MRQAIRLCSAPDGVRLAYATIGEGPPLVRVANWLTHLEHDFRSPVWRHWLEGLSDGRRLVRFDLRGSGLSDPDAEKADLETWVSDLEAVVDHAGLERFPLLGLCQGGAIATAFAARHPERVSALVLYDSFGAGAIAREERLPEKAREVRSLTRLIEMGWGRETEAYRELFAKLLMPDAAPEHLRDFGELQRRSASPENAARLWEAFHTLDVRAEARRVRVPTLVAHVRGDTLVPFEEGRRLAHRIPGARLVPLESRNHILRADEPAWPHFLEELRAFLGEAEGAGAKGGSAGPFEALTAREREVLARVARGLSNEEIAAELGMAAKTVRNHVSNLFAKLGVRSRAQAIVRSREAGLA